MRSDNVTDVYTYIYRYTVYYIHVLLFMRTQYSVAGRMEESVRNSRERFAF